MRLLLSNPSRGLVLAFAWAYAACPLASADTLVLHGGGTVRGRWINRDERPLRTYVLQTDTGGRVTVAADRAYLRCVDAGQPQ
mgnify:CR=1 FL=1